LSGCLNLRFKPKAPSPVTTYSTNRFCRAQFWRSTQNPSFPKTPKTGQRIVLSVRLGPSAEPASPMLRLRVMRERTPNSPQCKAVTWTFSGPQSESCFAILLHLACCHRSTFRNFFQACAGESGLSGPIWRLSKGCNDEFWAKMCYGNPLQSGIQHIRDRAQVAPLSWRKWET